MKHLNKTLIDKAFTYHITGYDNVKHEYILINTISKEMKRIPKNDVDEMIEEQHPGHQHDLQHSQEHHYHDPHHAQLHDPHHDFHQLKLHDPHHDLHHHAQLHDPHTENHD